MTGYSEYVAGIYPLICTEIKSNKSLETYDWLGATPKMQEWISERAPKGMLEHNFTVKNKDFEASIKVDRNAIEDDLYGQVTLRAHQLGEEAKRYLDEYISTTVANGTVNACYDGQNFFSTSHSEGASGTQSNSPSASASYKADTSAHINAGARLAISAMQLFKNDQGKLAGVNPTHVMVPTALQWIFQETFDPNVIGASGGSSVKDVSLKGRLKIIVNPYLTTDGSDVTNSVYYYLDLSKSVKPFIFQNRKEPEFVALDKPDDYGYFMKKEILYGVDMRFNMAYGDWRLCYRVLGA